MFLLKCYHGGGVPDVHSAVAKVAILVSIASVVSK